MCAGARRSVLLTTLLGVLNGNNAGSRKLPRQFWRGLEIPNIIDVAGRRRRGDDSRFSWCRVGRRPITILARDRLEETLTVLKLGLPPTLRRFFATTNCIENLIGTLRHVTRNIKRWRDGDMRRRWVGLGLLRAAERFRRIKQHGELSVLVTALGAAKTAERAA